MKTILLWVTTVGLVVFGQILEGGHVGSVMQPTAGILVFGPVLTYIFYAYGVRGFFSFFKRVIISKVTTEDSPIIDTIVTLGFLFAGVACVIGLIHVMENLADTSRLGAGIALAFVSVIYGALPAILLLPVKNHVHGKAAGSSDMLKKSAGFTAASFMMLMFSLFVVLYATSYKG